MLEHFKFIRVTQVCPNASLDLIHQVPWSRPEQDYHLKEGGLRHGMSAGQRLPAILRLGSGMSTDIKLLLYKSIIRVIVTYVAPVRYSKTSNTIKEILEAFQNRVIWQLIAIPTPPDTRPSKTKNLYTDKDKAGISTASLVFSNCGNKNSNTQSAVVAGGRTVRSKLQSRREIMWSVNRVIVSSESHNDIFRLVLGKHVKMTPFYKQCAAFSAIALITAHRYLLSGESGRIMKNGGNVGRAHTKKSIPFNFRVNVEILGRNTRCSASPLALNDNRDQQYRVDEPNSPRALVEDI
ncbi:hypothetical protein J6590_066262 [Homalodisca vitripennis]|nr:hypothetical protein J6590_066262 [Homalodisca vitripennis]